MHMRKPHMRIPFIEQAIVYITRFSFLCNSHRFDMIYNGIITRRSRVVKRAGKIFPTFFILKLLQRNAQLKAKICKCFGQIIYKSGAFLCAWPIAAGVGTCYNSEVKISGKKWYAAMSADLPENVGLLQRHAL